MKSYIYAVVVVVIILVLYNLATWNTNTYEDYIYGFWVAENDDFCEASEIDSMLLFIGRADHGFWSTTRTCYLIIMNDMCNQGLTLTYTTGWAGIGIGKYRIVADAKFDDEQIWDSRVVIEADMRKGMLRITGTDDTVYAVLNKQHDTTNLASALENAELV